jgi:hypothetical protein
MNLRRLSLVLMLVGLAPAPAQACGGLFCDQAPNPFTLPVAQTAENVLFAMEPGPDGQQRLEAHVQIFYTGPASRFSWVVPVDGDPTVDVGTNRLFDLLDPATRPQFAVQWQVDGVCRSSGVQSSPGLPGGSFAATGGTSGAADAAAAAVQVSFRGDVGPYDAAVLSATDPKALLVWLADNGYFVTPEAAKLINDYVVEGKHFVAIKLISGHDVSEIQPLVMRFLGPGPCVPLRLTSIASLPDLRINLWVLAANRVVPSNYYEITVDPARIDWLSGGSNYDALVKQAANEAGGNAFVTDYSGATPLMSSALAVRGADIPRLAAASSPADAVNQLVTQGIAPDGALIEILRKFIPEPAALVAAGVSEPNFYNQVASFWQQNPEQFAPFDAAGMAALVDARIVKPRKSAGALLDRYPMLTRLGTFISPEEMTLDPLFFANTTLPPVTSVRTISGHVVCGNSEFEYCQAPVRLDLPDGQVLHFPRGACGDAGVDRSALDQAPALERGWKRATQGEGLVRFDNRGTIRNAVAEHNTAALKVIAALRATASFCSTGGGGWDMALALVVGLAALVRRRRR